MVNLLAILRGVDNGHLVTIIGKTSRQRNGHSDLSAGSLNGSGRNFSCLSLALNSCHSLDNGGDVQHQSLVFGINFHYLNLNAGLNRNRLDLRYINLQFCCNSFSSVGDRIPNSIGDDLAISIRDLNRLQGLFYIIRNLNVFRDGNLRSLGLHGNVLNLLRDFRRSLNDLIVHAGFHRDVTIGHRDLGCIRRSGLLVRGIKVIERTAVNGDDCLGVVLGVQGTGRNTTLERTAVNVDTAIVCVNQIMVGGATCTLVGILAAIDGDMSAILSKHGHGVATICAIALVGNNSTAVGCINGDICSVDGIDHDVTAGASQGVTVQVQGQGFAINSHIASAEGNILLQDDRGATISSLNSLCEGIIFHAINHSGGNGPNLLAGHSNGEVRQILLVVPQRISTDGANAKAICGSSIVDGNGGTIHSARVIGRRSVNFDGSLSLNRSRSIEHSVDHSQFGSTSALVVDQNRLTCTVESAVVEYNLLRTIGPHIVGISTFLIEGTTIESLAGAIQEGLTINGAVDVSQVT